MAKGRYCITLDNTEIKKRFARLDTAKAHGVKVAHKNYGRKIVIHDTKPKEPGDPIQWEYCGRGVFAEARWHNPTA